jgi:hypothetical protein
MDSSSSSDGIRQAVGQSHPSLVLLMSLVMARVKVHGHYTDCGGRYFGKLETPGVNQLQIQQFGEESLRKTSISPSTHIIYIK